MCCYAEISGMGLDLTLENNGFIKQVLLHRIEYQVKLIEPVTAEVSGTGFSFSKIKSIYLGFKYQFSFK